MDQQLLDLCQKFIRHVQSAAISGMLAGADPAQGLAEFVQALSDSAQHGSGRKDAYNAMRGALYAIDIHPDELMMGDAQVFNAIGEIVDASED